MIFQFDGYSVVTINGAQQKVITINAYNKISFLFGPRKFSQSVITLQTQSSTNCFLQITHKNELPVANPYPLSLANKIPFLL